MVLKFLMSSYSSFAKDVVDWAKRFHADTKTSKMTSKCGEYVALPVDPLLASFSRTRFPVETGIIELMHREDVNQLQTYIRSMHGCPAVFVHGPPGVGTSYCLYEVVNRFRMDPNTRVIYIPDCGEWAAHMHENNAVQAINYLLYAISLAFPDDPSIEQRCFDCAPNEDSVFRLLKVCLLITPRNWRVDLQILRPSSVVQRKGAGVICNIWPAWQSYTRIAE
jgi:hypothetical protein